MLGFALLVGGAAWMLFDAQGAAEKPEDPGTVAARAEPDAGPEVSLPRANEPQETQLTSKQPTSVPLGDGPLAVAPGTPRASISGTVQNSAREPLANASLSIYQGNPLLSGPFPGSRRVIETGATSDAEGAFELSGVPVGKDYVVVAEHEEYARTEMRNQRLDQSRPITGLVITMGDGAKVEGRVADSGDVALPGARVEFYDNIVNAHLRLADQRPWKIVFADEAGQFLFEHVSSTAYRLRVSHPGYESQARAVSSAFETKARDQEVNFQLNPGLDIPGRVVDGQGRPVGQVYIIANSLTKDYSGTSEATSKVDGTFLLEGLGENDYQLRAEAEGYTRLQRRINITDGEIQIELQKQVGAELWVTSAAGEPVTAFTASLMRAHPGRDPSLTNDQRVVRDAQGHTFFDDLDPGSYALRIDAAGFAPAMTEAFEVQREQPAPELHVQLVGGGTLRGKVLTFAGEGVEGALVRVHPNNYQDRFIDSLFGPPPPERKIQMRTGSDGSFELKNIAPGSYQLRATKHDSPPAIRNDVTVFDDELRKNLPLELRLPVAASIKGRALDDLGRPMPFVTVQVTRDAEFNEVLTTDKSGSFEIGNLLEGNYKLSLRPERDDEGKPLNPLIAMVYSKQSMQEHYLRSGQKLDGVVIVAPPMVPSR